MTCCASRKLPSCKAKAALELQMFSFKGIMANNILAVLVIAAIVFSNSLVSVEAKGFVASREVDSGQQWASVLSDARQWKNKVQARFYDLPQISTELVKTFDSNFLSHLSRDYSAVTSIEGVFECLACKLAIITLQELLKLGESHDSIGNLVADLCKLFKIEEPDVCRGIVDAYREEVFYVLSRTGDATESVNYICGVIADDLCFGAPSSSIEWNITFPNIPKPPVISPKPPMPESPKLRVLHLTDIHLDLLYKSGSNSDCGKPLCCHGDDPDGEPAGKWGDYGTCDIPLRTVDDLLRNLSQSTKFDYILWTGDVSSHHVWNESRATQLYQLENLTQLFLTYFPSTPFYCAVGNHESFPVNSFPPPFIKGNRSNSWLYEGLRRSWMQWLPKDAEVTISRGGFYTTLLKPGFRIIALNDIYCSSGNWWLFLNSTDPANELSWLVEVLQKAETDGDKVHIIGHIPPGALECLRTWSWNYYQIVNRYEGVIAAQFFGHKHFDMWEIFYDEDFQRPISVAYIAPSLTTYVHLNPGYRVYEIDGFYANSSWMVLDHETFIMNLTESNLKNQPVWKKEYSAKLAYNMTQLTPKDWNDVTQKLLKDDEMFSMFREFYYKSNGAYFPPCDDTCRRMMVCELRTGLSHDVGPCRDILDAADERGFIASLREKDLC